MKKGEERKFDVKVRSITKIERQKEDSDITKYRLVASDVDGINEIIIVSGQPFSGININDPMFQVILRNSQLSIKDFEKEKKEKEEE